MKYIVAVVFIVLLLMFWPRSTQAFSSPHVPTISTMTVDQCVVVVNANPPTACVWTGAHLVNQ